MANDLTQTQEDLLKSMQAGEVLKESKHSGDILIVGRCTSKVLRATVHALVKAGRIRDSQRLDENGNKLFELVTAPPLVAKPALWPFPVSAHDWSRV